VARAERFPQAGRAFHRSASQVTRHHPVSRRLSLPTCPSYGPRGLSWWSTCKPQVAWP